MPDNWIEACGLPVGVRALTTLREGGVSDGAFHSWNLASHVGDASQAVAQNRERLQALLPHTATLHWLNQVHGTRCVDLDSLVDPVADVPEADALITRRANRVIAVLTADCLPVVLAGMGTPTVAIAHAGWRGLSAGVLSSVVRQCGEDVRGFAAWIGPSISQNAFEVGPEVRAQMAEELGQQVLEFFRQGRDDRWWADLQGIARSELNRLGVERVVTSPVCTVTDRRCFSYRRDGTTGRMATVVWRESNSEFNNP
jgi:YfiH family protein